MNSTKNKDITIDQNPFINADPLTKLLFGRLKLNLVTATILVLVIPVLPIYFVALITKLWFTRPDFLISVSCCFPVVYGIPKYTHIVIGLLSDYGWWWYQLISWPATIAFFFWMSLKIPKVIENLQQNGLIVVTQSPEDNEDSLEEFTNNFANIYSHPVCLIGALILLVMYMTVNYIPDQATYLVWTRSGKFIFWWTQLVHALMLYFMFVILVRGVITVRWFGHLFQRFKTNVRILHPDGAGGLSPYGDLIIKTGYFLGIYGFTLLILLGETQYRKTGGDIPFFTLDTDKVVIPMMFLYLIIAPILFFLLVRHPRAAMTEAKNDFLRHISEQLTTDLATVRKSLSNIGYTGIDYAEIKQTNENIEQLKKSYSVASDFPVWPIRTRYIVRFFTSFLSPIFIAILIFLLEEYIRPFIVRLIN